jgi:hypothetical protein
VRAPAVLAAAALVAVIAIVSLQLSYSSGPSQTAAVVTEMRMGSPPSALAVSPDGGLAYLAGSDAQEVVNLATRRQSNLSSLSAVGELTDVALSPNRPFAFFTSEEPPGQQGPTVYVLNTMTRTVVAEISVGGTAFLVTFSSSGNEAYVVTGRGISVINVGTDGVTASIWTGFQAAVETLSPDGRTLYLASEPTVAAGLTLKPTAKLAFVDLPDRRVTRTLNEGTSIVSGLALDSRDDDLYETFCPFTGGNQTAAPPTQVINARTGRVQSTIPLQCAATAITRSGTELVGASDYGDSIALVDLRKGDQNTTIGLPPGGDEHLSAFQISTDGKTAYVDQEDDGSVGSLVTSTLYVVRLPSPA